jgi:branched-chain amino acid transport system substrate-binding protein
MKRFCTLAVVMVMAGLVAGLSCAKKEVPPIKIGALLAVSGGASFLGAPEAKTAEMIVEEINAAGGILGRKVQLVVKDTQGKPENAVSFTKQLIEEEKVFAIIGPSTSGESMQIKKLCDDAQVILISCAAAEGIVNPLAKFVFKTPQKDSQAAQKIFDTMKSLGIKNIGVITANTGFGNGGKQQLEALAPACSINIVISEQYEKDATDLSGVLTKLKAKKVQAVVNWSIEPVQSIVPKNMKQIKFDVPLFQSHGFGNIKYVEAAGEAADGIIFPCGRLLVADVLAADHPQKQVLTDYKTKYEAKYNEAVSTFGGHAWDALKILVQAIQTAGGTDDKEKVRAAIENTKGFVGTAGVFNFTPEDHNGLGLDAFEMLTVQGGKFALYTGPVATEEAKK